MFIINCKWDKIFMFRSKSVVGKAEDAIHWINVYPADEAIGFLSAYQLDSDLSGRQRSPTLQQLWSEESVL